MSTEVNSLYSTVTLIDEGDDIGIETPDHHGGTVTRAVEKHEFIAAVEKELDATVILHSDLPEVKTPNARGDYVIVDGSVFSQMDAESARKNAMKYFAAAAFLEKNPPVDENMVEAVAALIAREKGWYSPNSAETPETMARSLVQQGVRVEVTE